MSPGKTAAPNWILRLAVLALVAAGIIYGVAYTLRPVALVAVAATGRRV